MPRSPAFVWSHVRCVVLLVVGSYCAGIAGCEERQPKTYPVVVKVVYPDGTPISGVSVVLISDEKRTTARGSTGPDGSSRLTTFKPDDGAVLGLHKVVVAEPSLKGDPDVPYTGPQIAEKFSSIATSGLEVTVTEDAAKNDFTLTVTPR